MADEEANEHAKVRKAASKRVDSAMRRERRER